MIRGSKTRIFAAIAAFGLMFAMTAPAMADLSDNENVTVTLTDSGVFAVSISYATLGAVAVNANTGGTVTGDVCVSFTDSKTLRGQFVTRLAATDFSSNTVVVPPLRANAGQPYKIAASRFEITKNWDVFQGRWSSWALANLGYEIGDIGTSSNGTDNDFSSGPYANSAPLTACGGAVVVASNVPYHDWTSAVSRTLNVNPIIGFGFAGPGTAGPFAPTTGSLQVLNTKLVVPAGQPADIYTSTLTVTVSPTV